MSVYDRIVQYYPDPEEFPLPLLYNNLGGGFPALIGNPAYSNTCAIRMSVALHGGGYPIPDEYRQLVAGDGRAIIINVKKMYDYLSATFGGPTWGMSKNPGSAVQVPRQKGIIGYYKEFQDATGHFDLWTGTGFVGSGKLSDVQDGFSVALWY